MCLVLRKFLWGDIGVQSQPAELTLTTIRSSSQRQGLQRHDVLECILSSACLRVTETEHGVPQSLDGWQSLPGLLSSPPQSRVTDAGCRAGSHPDACTGVTRGLVKAQVPG